MPRPTDRTVARARDSTSAIDWIGGNIASADSVRPGPVQSPEIWRKPRGLCRSGRPGRNARYPIRLDGVGGSDTEHQHRGGTRRALHAEPRRDDSALGKAAHN